MLTKRWFNTWIWATTCSLPRQDHSHARTRRTWSISHLPRLRNLKKSKRAPPPRQDTFYISLQVRGVSFRVNNLPQLSRFRLASPARRFWPACVTWQWRIKKENKYKKKDTWYPYKCVRLEKMKKTRSRYYDASHLIYRWMSIVSLFRACTSGARDNARPGRNSEQRTNGGTDAYYFIFRTPIIFSLSVLLFSCYDCHDWREQKKKN